MASIDTETVEYLFGPIFPSLKQSNPLLRTLKCDAIRLNVQSVTAGAHWRLCKSDSVQPGHCSTGLRVYSGADVMCFFLLHCLTRRAELASSEHYIDSHSMFDLNSPATRTIELGCGCGLTSLFTAFFAADCTWTDREESSLHFARENIKMLPEGVRAACRTFQCDWSIPSLTAMIEAVVQQRQLDFQSTSISSPPSIPNSPYAFDYVIATELLYYRVDLQQLMSALKFLLSPVDSSVDESSIPDSIKPIVLMAHLNRLVNGDQQLLSTAASFGLTLAYVPLSSFFHVEAPSSASASMDPIIQSIRDRTRGQSRNTQLVLVATSESVLQRRFGGLVPLSINLPLAVECLPEDSDDLLNSLPDDIL